MFVKDIKRDIQSVIKVSQLNNQLNEISEYVVTEEIYGCIKNFIYSYKNTLIKGNDNIGTWISGFFGSGKSHFLKILYYLLKGIGVETLLKNNENLLDIKEDLDFLSNVTKDVILFNIDAKNLKEDSMLEVFLNEFNSTRGFCKNYGFICDLEEQLVEENLYCVFKKEFLNISGTNWEESREKFYFYKEKIIETISKVKSFSYEVAEEYFLSIEKNYKITIDKFATKVNLYIKDKGNNHNVVFMVDEVSQFISEDVGKILNLQTIVEELYNKCIGKAFVIVTSHVDITSITGNKKYDFSKIQSRFGTRIYLSSVNMDEVLYKRLLSKKKTYEVKIGKLFEEKKFVFKNTLVVDSLSDLNTNNITKKQFIDCYPFLPYYLNLLLDVIYFLSKNQVISDDISKGERSIIGFFQRVLISFEDLSLNKVIPFYMFYEPLLDFIDHNHKYVFSIAKENVKLDDFDINILKSLFLIKYIPSIIPTINTVMALSISEIDNLSNFKNKVLNSLKKLINEGFLNCDGDKYYFLSKIERDINYKIIKNQIDSYEIKEFICKEIFDNICKIHKVNYEKKITFSLNLILDEVNYKFSSKNLIGFKILTTDYDENFNADSIRVLSSIENNVIVYLKDDKSLIEEISMYLKLSKFLKYNKLNMNDYFNKIILHKEKEINSRLERIYILINDCIKNSLIFVNGEEIKGNFNSVTDIFINSINRLINCRFNKLCYINKFVKNLPEINELMKSENKLYEFTNLNSLFLKEMVKFINEAESIKFIDIEKYFSNIPYGFNRKDILLGILLLIKENKILCDFNIKEVKENISNREFINNLEIKRLNNIDLKEFSFCKKVLGEYFNKKYLQNEFQEFYTECIKDFETLYGKLNEIRPISIRHKFYPDKELINVLDEFIKNILSCTSNNFLNVLNSNNNYVENLEKFEVIYNFYVSIQFSIFNDAIKIYEIFLKDKNYIENEDLKNEFLKIEYILKNKNPYPHICKLKCYVNKFSKEHNEILRETIDSVKNFINKDIYNFISEELFIELMEKIENANTLFDIYGIKMESMFLKDRKLK